MKVGRVGWREGGKGGSQKNTNKKPLLCSFSNVDVFNLGLPPPRGVPVPPPPLVFPANKGSLFKSRVVCRGGGAMIHRGGVGAGGLNVGRGRRRGGGGGEWRCPLRGLTFGATWWSRGGSAVWGRLWE